MIHNNYKTITFISLTNRSNHRSTAAYLFLFYNTKIIVIGLERIQFMLHLTYNTIVMLHLTYNNNNTIVMLHLTYNTIVMLHLTDNTIVVLH